MFFFLISVFFIFLRKTPGDVTEIHKDGVYKEESEDIRIAEVFSIKHEDTEEQTGWFLSQSWTQSFDSYSQYSSTEINHIYEECHMIFLIMAFIWPEV